MALLLNPEQHYAVERDGLPRVAAYDDGTQRVLYRNGGWAVQSMGTDDWLAQRGPLPTDPTQAQIDAALLAQQQAAQQAQTDAAQLRQQILTLAQSTVGMRIDAVFTNAQLKSLLAVLLWKSGAIALDLTIRPLAQWINN